MLYKTVSGVHNHKSCGTTALIPKNCQRAAPFFCLYLYIPHPNIPMSKSCFRFFQQKNGLFRSQIVHFRYFYNPIYYLPLRYLSTDCTAVAPSATAVTTCLSGFISRCKDSLTACFTILTRFYITCFIKLDIILKYIRYRFHSYSYEHS